MVTAFASSVCVVFAVPKLTLITGALSSLLMVVNAEDVPIMELGVDADGLEIVRITSSLLSIVVSPITLIVMVLLVSLAAKLKVPDVPNPLAMV